MRLLVLPDLHTGISRQSSTHPGIVRQANSRSLETLTLLTPKFNQMGFDYIIQLGDLIRDVDKVSDAIEINKTLEQLAKLTSPIINLVGNHDIKNLTKDELTKIYIDRNFSPNYFGVTTFSNTQIIWLDFDKKDGEALLPSNQIEMIEQSLLPDKNKIIFSHYSLVKKNTDGNFYFDKNEKETRYKNLDEIQSFLTKNSIKLVINGHEHWVGVKKHNDVNYLTLPSFSENITNSADLDVCPGAYSIVDIENNQVTINSYSGDYSFFHLELSI